VLMHIMCPAAAGETHNDWQRFMGMTKILDTIGDDQPWVGNSVGVEYAKQFGTSTNRKHFGRCLVHLPTVHVQEPESVSSSYQAT
jgi:hypothetical protein